MRRLLSIALVLALTVAFGGGTALAAMCPSLVKLGREAAAKAKADDPKVKQAVAKLDQAEKLHKDAKHAESVKAADEALALLGVKKPEAKKK